MVQVEWLALGVETDKRIARCEGAVAVEPVRMRQLGVIVDERDWGLLLGQYARRFRTSGARHEVGSLTEARTHGVVARALVAEQLAITDVMLV